MVFDCYDFLFSKAVNAALQSVCVRMDARGRCDVLWQAEAALCDTCYSAYHL